MKSGHGLMRKLDYRNDVDGLRFFAVLVVILDHFELGLPGGFIGVDVFYVISGYVISRQLEKQIRSGEFSIARFWSRRLWRLGPALLIMLVVVSVGFTFLLSPTELVVLYKNTIANYFYVSNVFVWREYGGYFSSLAKEAPLLHTWSISVEEQFYIIWPGMLFVLLAIKARYLYYLVLVVLFIVSLLFSEYATNRTIAAGYYLLPTRFFELLLGCMVALFALDKATKYPVFLQHLMSLLGAALLVGSATFYSSTTTMPGFNALVPTVGAVLYLCSRGGCVNQMLSLQPLSFGGKLSYSLYLWHWPVAVALFYTGHHNGLEVTIGIIFVFIISYLSYTYVENPCRSLSPGTRRKYVFLGFLSLFSFSLVFLFAGISFKGFESRYNSEQQAAIRAIGQHPNSSGCLVTAREWNAPFDSACTFGEGKKSVLLLGDSHANHFSEFVKVFTEFESLTLHEYTMDSCNPVFDLLFSKEGNQHKAEICQNRNEKLREFVVVMEPDYVILAGNWPNKSPVYFSNSEDGLFGRKLKSTIEYIESMGVRVIILREVPGTGLIQHNCPVKNITLGHDASCHANVERNIFMDDVMSILQETTNVIEVDVRGLICEGETCEVSVNGIPLYRDNSHLNSVGSRQLGISHLRRSGSFLQ